jgi:hypothetical protein
MDIKNEVLHLTDDKLIMKQNTVRRTYNDTNLVDTLSTDQILCGTN